MAWPSISLICWKPSRPTTRSATSPCSVSARAIMRGEPGVERVAVGEPRQRVVLGEIPDLFRLALAHRDVAQDRAILVTLGALPAGEAGLHRKHLAVVAPAVELDDGAGRAAGGFADRQRVAAVGANRLERLTDHVLGAIAEHRGRAGVPHRDAVVGVGADQAVAERHRDALEAALRDTAEQGADVDLVERDGGDVGDDGDMEQRGVEHERKIGLQHDAGRLDRQRGDDQRGGARAGAEAAPGQHHRQHQQQRGRQR